MGDFGFKVSKTGYDVNTATNDQLAMTSALVSDKVALYGSLSGSLTAPSTQVTITLAHGLGYAPQFKIYDFTNDTQIPFIAGDTSGTFSATDAYADATNIKVRFTTNTGNSFPSLAYIYQVMYNPI